MVAINYANREVSCKIVYYGPGLSGKTTNLQYIHGKVPGTTRGDLISLATDADRTLYFDFLPINIGSINGFTTRFQLYTVPGQVFYNATRKLVLRGVDGLIFVADSQRDKADENVESLNNLIENLEEYDYDIKTMPLILQYNKQDLPDVMSVDELNQLLNKHNWPVFESVAHKGTGVFDTLKLIIKMILAKAKKSGTAEKIDESKQTDTVSSEPENQLPEPVQSPNETVMQKARPIPSVVPVETPIAESTSPIEVSSQPAPEQLAASAESGGIAAAVAELEAQDKKREVAEPEKDESETVIETNQDFNPEPVSELSAENKTINPLQTENIEENSLAESSRECVAVADEPIPQVETEEKQQTPLQIEESQQEIIEETSEQNTDSDDPFAVPSVRPKMAVSMRLKNKKKKGFFLFRWLFGRK
jgi:mutual gliding-motility protein MglA